MTTFRRTQLTATFLLILSILAVFVESSQQQTIATSVTTNDGSNDASLSQPSDDDVVPRSAPKNAPYFQASLPMRIYECLRDFSLLRCTKLFMLQKFEERKQWPHTGNLTSDFIQQFFDTTSGQLGSLTSEKYAKMSDKELNKRLVVKFQRFFKNRDIKLQVLPGITVRVVPSKSNTLTFALKKKHHQHHAYKPEVRSLSSSLAAALTTSATKSAEASDDINVSNASEIEPDSSYKGQSGGSGGGHGGGGGILKRKNKKQHSYKGAMIQMAVPILIMPAILLGSFLPFILPALKMATIMSIILNNSAFMAALMYAARTHANSQDEQHITYGSYSHGIGTSYH